MQEGKVMHRDYGWHSGIERRDKVRAVKQIQREADKFYCQRRLFDTGMDGGK